MVMLLSVFVLENENRGECPAFKTFAWDFSEVLWDFYVVGVFVVQLVV